MIRRRDCSPLLRVFLLAMLGMVGACGYHLRGMADKPAWLNDVAVVVHNAHRDLDAELKTQLEAYHIRTNHSAAQYCLIIEQDRAKEEIISVSSSTTPRQYQMIYKVQFSLQDAKGKELVRKQWVRVTRQITINSDRILGSNYETTLLAQEMRHAAIVQIIDRIGHAKP